MANKEVIFKLNIDGGSSLSIIKQIQQELGKLNNEFSKTNTGAQLDTRIAALSKSLTELKSKGGGESLTGLRQEIKLLDLELTKLPKNTIEYNNQLKKLAERRADLADLRTSINALDPEKKVEALAKVGTAIVGGYSAALGLTNLLGESNKELEASLLKVQSALGVLSGLQAIINAKDDLKILAVATGFDKLKVSIFGTAAAGEGANVSFKALRATLASLGIGAIAIGIGLLIENWEKVKTAITGVSKQQAEFNQIRSESLGSIAQEREQVGQLVQEYNNAATTDERRKQIKEDLIKTSPTYFAILNKEKVSVDDLTTAYEKWAEAVLLKAENDAIIKKIGEERIKILETENSTVQDNVNLFESAVNLLTSFGNTAEFAGKQIIKGAENQIKSVKEASDNIDVLQQKLIENNKKLQSTGGDPTAKDNSKKEAEDRLKQIEENFNKEIELIKRGENEKKTALLQSKPNEEELDFGNFQIDLESLNKTIEIYKKYGKDISDLLLSRSQLEYEQEKKAAEAKIKLIEENKKREEEAKSKFEKNTDDEYQQDLDNLKTYIGQRQLEIANSNKSEQEKDRELTALKKFELENRLQINKDYGKSVQSSEEELTQFLISEAEKRTQLIVANNVAAIEATATILQGISQIIAESTASKFDEQRQVIDEFLTEQTNKLDALSEQERLNLDIQLAQGLISQTEYKQKELALAKKVEAEKLKLENDAKKQRKKFDFDEAVSKRKIAIANIAINIAEAVAKELATKGTIGFAFIAPLLAAGIAQSAVVLSQPLPALAKGGMINNTSNSTINNSSTISEEEVNRIMNSFTSNSTTDNSNTSQSSVSNNPEFNSSSNSLTKNFVNNIFSNSSNEEKENIYNRYFTNNYNGGGTLVNNGTTGTADDVLIKISKGESVINAAATKRFKPLLSAINQSTGGRAFASGGIPIPGSSSTINNIPLGFDNKEQVELLQQVRDLLSVPNRSYVVETDITSTQSNIKRIEANTEW